MSKTVLLTSASVIIFSAATYANPEFDQRADVDTLVGMSAHTFIEKSNGNEIDLSTPILSEETVSQKLPADLIVDFAKFSYSVDKKAGWQTTDKAIYNKLINDGWILDAFDGTTGTANNQVESVSGLLAFKDDQVVIATRGTEMTNWNDWMTNVRFSRSPITRFFADESNKLGAITAQFFGGVEGEVANGFLQTHLSSWDYIKEAILKRAQSLGKSTKDLQYTITGHSKGAAKAQLNALNLLTDSTLGIGVDFLERSTILTQSTADFDLTESQADLWGSGFYMPSIKSEPKNKGNVDTVVFESPRVFSDVTAEQVNAIIGKDNLIRVENRNEGWKLGDVDPVVLLTPAFLGFKHAGTTVQVDSGDTSVERHMMGNVGKVAVPAIEARRAELAQKTTDVTNVKTEETTYFGKAVVNGIKNTVENVAITANVIGYGLGMGAKIAAQKLIVNPAVAVKDATINVMSNLGSAAQKAWGYFWN